MDHFTPDGVSGVVCKLVLKKIDTVRVKSQKIVNVSLFLFGRIFICGSSTDESVPSEKTALLGGCTTEFIDLYMDIDSLALFFGRTYHCEKNNRYLLYFGRCHIPRLILSAAPRGRKRYYSLNLGRRRMTAAALRRTERSAEKARSGVSPLEFRRSLGLP